MSGDWILCGLAPTLQAALVFGLFGFVPGYVAGWLANVCGFRRGSALRQLALSVPLSIALVPIAVYLPWRFLSVQAVWWMLGAVWACFPVIIAVQFKKPGMRGMPAGVNGWTTGIVAIALWTVVAMASLPDLRIGRRLYYSVTAYDYLSRVPIANSISRQSQLPPQSPFLNPGYPVPLRYHYFWPMVCGLAQAAGGIAFQARDAVNAGTLWSGGALICLIAVYLRFFLGWESSLWRRYAIALALLFVTGLDIVPALTINLVNIETPSQMLASIEWWNVQVTGWLDAMLWVPHHIAALVAGMVALFLMRQPPRVFPLILAAMALASCGGLSVDVAFVFAVFLAVWFLFSCWNRDLAAIRVNLAVSSIAAVLAAAFLLELAATGASAGFIHLHVREFSLLPETGRLLHLVLRLAVLPLNYALEFGVYLYAAAIYWNRQRGRLSIRNSPAVVLLATSTLMATFLVSSGGNDLDLRSFLPTQFILLLCAASVLVLWNTLKPVERRSLMVLAIIGISSTVLDLTLLRFFPLFQDSQAFASQEGGSNRDHRIGRRDFAIAEAYTWIRRSTNEGIVIQGSPTSVVTPYGLYADRSGLAMGGECDGYSGRAGECKAIKAALQPLFTGTAGSTGFTAACRAFPVDLLVFDANDPVWRFKNSWIWAERPVFENEFTRVLSCHPR